VRFEVFSNFKNHFGKSTPPQLHGLQRSTRQIARGTPKKNPFFLSDKIAYSEQLGKNLQPQTGFPAPEIE
jgi:hypothetical protein